jgi:hypothetical protein
MFNFQFLLSGLGFDHVDIFQSVRSITKNKMIEVTLYRDGTIIDVHLSITSDDGHAGAFVSLSLLGLNIMVHIYDNRHWYDDIS